MNLIHQIEELSVHYNSTRQGIAEFVLKERTRLHKYSIQEIVDKTYTSKSALTRFAKSLGFTGWKDFLNTFMEEQQHHESYYSDIDPNYPFEQHSLTSDIINQVCSLQVESLLETADFLDNGPVDKVVDLLYRAKRVAIFGLSPNLQLAELFVRKMLSIGVPVETSLMGDVGLMASSLGENDCAILVSYSGNTVDRPPLHNVLCRLIQNHVPIVAITSDGDSTLANHAKYILKISSRERLYSKIATFATETSILYILNILFSCYFVKDYDRNLLYKIENGRQLEEDARRSSSPDITEHR